MNTELLNIAGALLAVLIGYLLGHEQHWYKARHAAVGVEMWKARSAVYKKLMEHIGLLPAWPSRKHETTYYDLLKLTRQLRDWYYTDGGGLFLSEDSRKKYQAVQQAIRDRLEDRIADNREVRDKLESRALDDYDLIRDLLSALRKEMSKDLTA